MAVSLWRSTAVVGAMTLLSRILGFARDMVLARMFGAGGAMDAFLVAFKIPNFLRRLFAEGSFSQAFVPVLAEQKNQQSPEEVRRVVGLVTGTLGLILLGITALGVLGAPVLITLFAPGFADDTAQFNLASGLLHITFPYLFFISLTALAGGVLNTYGSFAPPAFTPVLLNLSFILIAPWLARELPEPIYALAWAVFFAGVAQLLFQVPFLWRISMLAWPRWGWRDPVVKRILTLMLPSLFGSSIAQVNLLLDTLIASFLAAGSVSWLYYSDRLMEFPLGLFGIALGTVLLPSLSSRHAENDRDKFSDTLDWGLRLVLVLGVPAAVGLGVFAEPIVATLFYSREFDLHDVDMAAASLTTYTVGLMGFVAVKILVPGYFARQDTRTPVRIGITCMGANMLFNLILIPLWLWFDYPAPHAGLALSTGLASLLNAALLYRGLRRDDVYRPRKGWWRLSLRVIVAAAAMAALLKWAQGVPADWAALRSLHRVGNLVFWISMAAALYFAVLTVAGLRPRHLRSPETP